MDALTIILIILAVVAALALALVAVIAMRPADFRIERSTTINASPATVFTQINDFHNWGAWSPWDKIDPNLNRTYDGAPSGTGAIYHWVGNKQVGEGRMTITDCTQNELIVIRLEFIKPFSVTHTAEFRFRSEADQTVVTWIMLGTNNFLLKAFSLVMNMDKMIGNDFEKGLAQMKTIAEAQPKE